MRVFVYYNLHKKLWSIKALEGPLRNKVIHHGTSVLLRDPVPKVSEAGRQRVLRDRRKNVHAGLVGYLWAWENRDPVTTELLGEPFDLSSETPVARKITYNPYRYSTFVYKDTEEVYTGSGFAHFTATLNREVLVA